MINETQLRAAENEAERLLEREGHEGLYRALLAWEDDSDQEAFVRRAFRLLEDKDQENWPESLVDLAVFAVSDEVSFRATYWHLDSLGQQKEPTRDRIVSRLRDLLLRESIARSARAARALTAIGYRYDGSKADFEAVLDRFQNDQDQLTPFVLAAANFAAIPEASIAQYITTLLRRGGDYDNIMTSLVWRYGTPRHIPDLKARMSGGDEHDVLGGMLGIASRHVEVQKEVADAFLDASREVRGGLEHYVYRFLDDERIVNHFLDKALADATSRRLRLIDVNLVKSSVRPAHLAACERYTQSVDEEAWKAIEEAVVTPTGQESISNTHESFVKENALFMASHLGQERLRDWMPAAIAGEMAPFLIARMAEDCVFWGIRDFVRPLMPRMGEHNDRNPMWLVSDEAGAAGGNDTILALLECEGRVAGHGDALMSYVQGLAYAAINEGDASLLLDAAEKRPDEAWRFNAAAQAVRQSALREPSPKIDWNRVLKLVEGEDLQELTRHELLIATATECPQQTAAILAAMPEHERARSRVLLARVLCDQDVPGVVRSLSKYLEPIKGPYTHTFESSYAALTLARLYERGHVDGTSAMRYLSKGLEHEIDAFCRGCQGLRAEDEGLSNLIWESVLARNNSWSSDPSMWSYAARLVPNRLLAPGIEAHLERCNASAIKGYLDALIHGPVQGGDHQADAWRVVGSLLANQPRAVSWQAAYTASVVCPQSVRESLDAAGARDDRELRRDLELALWLDDLTWQSARRSASVARWSAVRNHAIALDEERERLKWADIYIERVFVSENLLRDWKYAQALLRVPSERVLHAVESRASSTVAESFLARWLHKNVRASLKKRREELWKESRLSQEDPFPSGF